jgi:Tetracyclin repressor-like, C-terminal domain
LGRPLRGPPREQADRADDQEQRAEPVAHVALEHVGLERDEIEAAGVRQVGVSVGHAPARRLALVQRRAQRRPDAGADQSDQMLLRRLHMMISAFCVFRVANRHTFGTLFERDLLDPELRERYRAMLGDMVVDYVSG